MGNSFSINGGGTTKHAQANEWSSTPTSYTKINVIWITDVSIRDITIELLEENAEVTLWYFRLGDVPHQWNKPHTHKIGELDFINIKHFYTSNDTIKKLKRPTT